MFVFLTFVFSILFVFAGFSTGFVFVVFVGFVCFSSLFVFVGFVIFSIVCFCGFWFLFFFCNSSSSLETLCCKSVTIFSCFSVLI